jgi:hypothetical protein
MPNTSLSQRGRFLKYFGFSVTFYSVQNKSRFFSTVDSFQIKRKIYIISALLADGRGDAKHFNISTGEISEVLWFFIYVVHRSK